MRRVRALLAGLAVAFAAPAAASAPELAFAREEGNNRNLFVRDGTVAAHVVLRSGSDPRVLIAFPAGNSGAALWFEPLPAPARWRVDTAPVPIRRTDARGRALNGVRFAVSIAAPRLVPRQALLTSVRYLRDYEALRRFPPEVATPLEATPNGLRAARDRVDGAPGYVLKLTVTAGRVAGGALVASPAGRIAVVVEALTGDAPLAGLPQAALLNAQAAPDPAARRALEFLSYRDKFLAGSWRFDTYFGRDTLMSVALLMPALQPAGVEAGLTAVLERLSPGGEVAHEESLGEFGAVARTRPVAVQAAVTSAPAPPVELDYKMVDDDYMLGPVAERYLLGGAGMAAARGFLARTVHPLTGPPVQAGALLATNLRYVIGSARPFGEAARPDFRQLIAIRPPFKAGQWRDSDDGIGGGTYAYDVNAVLVPAALRAAERLLRSGLLAPYLDAAGRAAMARAGALAAVWERGAPPLFGVALSQAEAADRVRAYAGSVGVPSAETPGGAAFNAIALDAAGRPVPVLHSDEGFTLFFGEPAPAALLAAVRSTMRPFPAGLMTPAGLLVANPAYAPPELQRRFGAGAYHGTVVWSWQQALFAAGLARQLRRPGLPAGARAELTAAETALWGVIEATRPLANSELWSWVYRDGRYRAVAFGAGRADVDESNAAQLWSTVYLAVRPPLRLRRGSR